jgi:hypothetical protein
LPVVQDQAVGLFDASEQIERSTQARARLAAVAGELVQTEEAVANVHDELAVRDSGVLPGTARLPTMPARRRGALAKSRSTPHGLTPGAMDTDRGR